MLNLCLAKVVSIEGVALISYSLFTKPSSIWKPLSPLSCHPASVHFSWPAGQLKRIVNRCQSKQVGLQHVIKFKRDFEIATRLDLDHLSRSTSISSSRIHGDVCWLVLPFNHCWASARFQRVLRDAMQTRSVILGSFFFKIAWRLGEPNLTLLFRRDTNDKASVFHQNRVGG